MKPSSIKLELPDIPSDPQEAAKVIKEYLEDLNSTFMDYLFDEFSVRKIAWLAIPPVWTNEMIERSRFRKIVGSKFIDKMMEQGVAEQDIPLEGEPGIRCNEDSRERILSRLKDEEAVFKYLPEITKSLHAALEDMDEPPKVLQRWVDISRKFFDKSSDQHAAFDWFINNKVQERIDAGQTDEANAWVEAAETFLPMADLQFEVMVRLAKRRVELGYRRYEDERHLRYFMPRPKQIEAFHSLLDDDKHWAIHFLGNGGMGKTMLLRYISGSLAKEMGCAVSRVDFDFLSPDYPLRSPGQLLLELADGLSLYVRSKRGESLHERFQRRMSSLYDALDREPPPGDPLSNIRRPEFEIALDVFVEFVRKLEKEKVVLILDTCEELAKLRPDSGRQPRVEATLEILEKLHDQLPELRVVFAGRRPLATAGAGWRIRDNANLPARRDYLSLHLIRGFSREEVSTFFHKHKNIHPEHNVQNAILERCRAQIEQVPIEWDEETALEATNEERYNPFELDLYADWFNENKNLSAKEIAESEADPYIKMRIVDRIKNKMVRRALPAAVLLRCFDQPMFQKILEIDEKSVEDIFQELKQLDWISIQSKEKKVFLEINRHLCPRLESYFVGTKDISPSFKQRVANSLCEYLDDRGQKLRLLDPGYLAAALRLSTDERAVSLWWRIHDRIPDEADWNWAKQVTESLLGREDEADKDRPIDAAILSTYIYSLRHTQSKEDPYDYWVKVEKIAKGNAHLPRYKELRNRALLGQIAAESRHQGKVKTIPLPKLAPWDEVCTMPDTPERKIQLAGSILSALEGLLEAQERGTNRIKPKGLKALVAASEELLKGTLDSPLVAFKNVLSSRLALWTEEPIVWLRPKQYKVQSHLFEDVTIPENPADYSVCLYLLLAKQGRIKVEAGDLENWRIDAMKRVHHSSARAVISLVFQHALFCGPPSTRRQIDEVRKRYSHALQNGDEPQNNYTPAFFETIPPLWCTLSEALAAQGFYEDAAERLMDHYYNPKAWDRSAADLRWGVSTALKIARRQRSVNVLSDVENRLRVEDKDTANLCELIRTSFLLGRDNVGRSFTPLRSGRILHACWQTQKDPKNFHDLQTILCSPAEQNALRLDATEIWLSRQPDLSPDELSKKIKALLDSFKQEDLKNESSRIQRMFEETDLERRNVHRTNVLKERKSEFLEEVLSIQSLPEKYRRDAEILLEEGELLLHRLPEDASRMLGMARAEFKIAQDQVGEFQAAALQTLSLVHAGLNEQAQANYDSILRKTYDNMKESFSAEEWAVVKKNDLQEWMYLMACLRQWISKSVKSITGEEMSTQEGTLRPELQVAGQELVEEAVTKPASRGRKFLKAALVIIGIGFVLFIVISIYVFLYKGFWWLGVKIIPSATEWGMSLKIPIFLVGIVLLGGVVAMGPRLNKMLKRAFCELLCLRFHIQPSPEGSNGVAKVAVEVSGRLSLLYRTSFVHACHVIWSLFQPSYFDKHFITRIVRLAVDRGSRQTYRGAADILPDQTETEHQRETYSFLKTLKGVNQIRNAPSFGVGIRIEKGFEEMPWEGLLYGLIWPEYVRTSSLVFVREYERTADAEPKSAKPLKRDPVVVLGESQWSELAKKIWSSESWQVETTQAGGVFHVIGNPVKTKSGVRLDLSSSTSSRTQSKDDLSSITQESLGPEYFRRHALHRLVIVQLQPSEFTEHTKSDYAELALLREFCHQAMLAGTQNLIMLPTLDLNIAERALISGIRCLEKKNVRSIYSYLDFVVAARRTIIGKKKEIDPGLVEVVSDINFFTAERLFRKHPDYKSKQT